MTDAVIDSDRDLSDGSTGSISFDTERAHLFDPDSGEIIAHTGREEQTGAVGEGKSTSTTA